MHDVFDARAADALALGRTPRTWPAKLTIFPHWYNDYDLASASADINLPLHDAIGHLNAWFDDIEQARPIPRQPSDPAATVDTMRP